MPRYSAIRRLVIGATVAGVSVAICLSAPVMAGDQTIAAARKLLLTGKCAEAAEAFQRIAFSDDTASATAIDAAIGLSRTQSERGQYNRAAKTLVAAQKKHSPRKGGTKTTPPAGQQPQLSLHLARLSAELAQIAFQRGQYKESTRRVEQSLRDDPNQLAARFLRGELHRVAGRLEEANAAYRWLVEYYNAHDGPWTAEQLHAVGLAATHYARWNRLSDQFSFLVNDLYPDILKSDPNYWRARLETARLFLEKFNKADAKFELQAALKINPQAAEIHVALAQLALVDYELDQAIKHIHRAQEINPNLLSAHLALADVHFANCEPRNAAEVLQKARPLNPKSEALLGRLAAAWGLIDGLPRELVRNSPRDEDSKDTDPGENLGADSLAGKSHPAQASAADSRAAQLIQQVTSEYPHAGKFFLALAESLDLGRKYPDSGRYFARAIEVMPQLVRPHGQLGLIHMRLGDEQSARRVLEEAFRIDPFNVRVSNTLKVLDVLDKYETLETEHFLIRYDGQKDPVLARCAADYLEQIYPELCQRLGYTLTDKALFEIFHDAQGTSGHDWFSARMVGLPNVHTIGACAGKMVAVTSPTSLRQRVNWARVLRHELVHVINLQQTDFNIPHWFTEALAVHCEDGPRPREWSQILSRRVPRGEVFDLSNINMAFIRPSTSEDWLMAYCQAEIYAEYMIARHGPDSLSKMLAAYHDNLSTPEAIERSFEVSVDEFERGYTAHLRALVQSLPQGAAPALPTLAELKKAQAERPDDLETTAQIARAMLLRGKTREAGELANRVLEAQPKHPLATYVSAKLLLSIGQSAQARSMLEDALDHQSPQSEFLKLLGGIYVKAEQYERAAQLFQLGAKRFPGDPDWNKSLAIVYLKQKDTDRLTACLTTLAELDVDDVVVRRKLAKSAFAAGDYQAAARWANQAVQIDVMDSQMSRLRAESLTRLGQHTEAARSFALAVMLQPDDDPLRLALAQAYLKSGESERAKQVALQLLQRAARNNQSEDKQSESDSELTTAARKILETP